MARPVDPNAKVELLRAAEAVFVERGLEKARVEEITARAGRSKGSFYLHFESKEEAFRQIVESTLARMATFLAYVDPEAMPADLSFREILEAFLEHEVELFEFLWQNRGVMRLLLCGGGSSQFGYLIDAFAERARQRTKAWLQAGIERGDYRHDLDVEVASLVIAGAYDRIARTIVTVDKKPDIRGWVRGIQKVLLGGLLSAAVRGVLDLPVTDRPSAPEARASDPGLAASPPSRLRRKGTGASAGSRSHTTRKAS